MTPTRAANDATGVAAAAPADPQYRACLWLSIAIGAVLGFGVGPEARALDGASVLAGIVHYPGDSAMGAYMHNLWTLLHQIPALLLAAGVSATAINLLINAVFGAATFCGIALLVFGLTRNLALAITVTFAIVIGDEHVVAPDYPVLFFTEHTYGMAGSALAYLVIGLLANRRWRAAAFVAGVAPAIHPVLGGWMLGITLMLAVGGLWKERAFRGGLATGLGVTIISFAVYWLMKIPTAGAGDPSLVQIYLDLWDYHRSFPYNATMIAWSAMLISLGMAYVIAAIADGRRESEWGVAAVLLSVAGSTFLYLWFHLARSSMPAVIARAIPSRLVDIHLALFVALIAGVLWRLRPVAFNRAASVLLVVAFLAPRRLGISPADHLILALLIALALALTAVSEIAPHRFRMPWAHWPMTRIASAAAPLLAALLLVPTIYVGSTRVEWQWGHASLVRGPAALAFFQRLGAIHLDGVVVAPYAPAVPVMRYGHKALAIDPTMLGLLPYLPEAAGNIADIITNVYGVDYRNPPPEMRHRDALSQDAGREYWARLSPQDWAALAARYCIGGVVTPGDWPTQLTPRIDTGGYRLLVPTETLPDRCRY